VETRGQKSAGSLEPSPQQIEKLNVLSTTSGTVCRN
jgi:hypothetical protein